MGLGLGLRLGFGVTADLWFIKKSTLYLRRSYKIPQKVTWPARSVY